jgi:hypothetical protein
VKFYSFDKKTKAEEHEGRIFVFLMLRHIRTFAHVKQIIQTNSVFLLPMRFATAKITRILLAFSHFSRLNPPKSSTDF